MRSRNLKAVLAGSVCALALSGAAFAQTKSFDVPAGDLGFALDAYIRQSGEQLIYKVADVRGLKTSGVQGALNSEEALQQLLSGTQLKVKRDPSGLIAIASAEGPQSQGAAGGGAEVEALIVTAQKREEDIQDVPIAISAFTQEALERSQVAGGPDLMTQVPNMTFTKTNFSSYSIQLRGIGTQAISATVDPAVAVAFNNTPFIRNRFFEQEFYDLQRVEVLRGPQGTLYGRNATAGVVNLISQKPRLGAYEAKLSADIANYSTTRLEGMINIPLANDVAALRLAGAWTKRDGYAMNEITGNPIDGRDLWSTRLSLRLAPTDALDVNLIWEHFEEDDDRLRSGKQLCKRHLPETIAGLPVPWGQSGLGGNNGSLFDETFSQGCEAASLYSPDSFQAPNGLRLPFYRALSRVSLPIVTTNPDGTAFDPYASTTQSHDLRVIESTVDPIYRAKSDIFELQFSLDVSDNLTLASETSYLRDALFSSQDYNRFNTRPGAFATTGNNTGIVAVQKNVLSPDGYFCDPQIGCANRLVAMDLSTAKSVQFSQEFRLGSDYEGPFNFSLGANFLRYDTEDKYYVFINTLSLYAASRVYYASTSAAPYEQGVTDNSWCLPDGLAAEPIFGKAQGIYECVYMDPNPITSLNDLGHNYFLSRNPYKLISYAVFGEAYYNITDNLKLTAGVRWTVDKKEAPRIPSWVLAANTVGYPVAETVEQEWREPTGRLTVDWKPGLGFTDDTLLYASYAHGYKAGGANPPAAGLVIYAAEAQDPNWELMALQQGAVAPTRFNPEFIDSFELGAKNTLLGGAVTVNAAAFYYDYTGYQISQIVNRSAINLNFDAEVWGLELEADWRPLENLRLGFKGGYESTRMADGSRAVDMMDRTAGNPNWFVSAPFPTLPANCVLPNYLVTRPGDELAMLGMAGGGALGPCELAYVMGLDPLTQAEYQANPPSSGTPYWYLGYPGFDPLAGSPGHPYTGQNTYNGVDYGPAPNGGAGFYKDLSGNELPNAPDFTATITADYTIPLPSNWLATLHTDLYYQSEAWTRVFNTEGYDKLKAYTNVNLAAIFTNDDAGWKVMAYIKNVFDRDSITGAFLNSDDTGLTTNVFLTEPRLFGLRVTKEFASGPWWTGANLDHEGPFPLTFEVGGQIQRHDAPYERLTSPWVDGLPSNIAMQEVQNRDFDTGDARSLKATYQPNGSPWSISGGIRYGRTNTDTARTKTTATDALQICGQLPGSYYALTCEPGFEFYGYTFAHKYNIETRSWADAEARSGEEHQVIDFAVGRDFGLGSGLKSTARIGIRSAEFKSITRWAADAQTDWDVPEGWAVGHLGPQYLSSVTLRHVAVASKREFSGAGPVISWDAALALWGDQQKGRLELDWSIAAGTLLGDRETEISGQEQTALHRGNLFSVTANIFGEKTYLTDLLPLFSETTVPIQIKRSENATVPLVDLSLGLSYDVGRVKLSTGYRWERYFDVLDVGYMEAKEADRTIDGPYFKLAVGFGG
ncbi:MAG TPA: TonB-dependent receptor [Caulobacteraceae bacterium]